MLMPSPGPQICPLHQRLPLIRPQTLRRLCLLRAGRHPPVSRAAWDHGSCLIRETETEKRVTIIIIIIMVSSSAHLAAWTLALGAKLPVKKLVSSTRPCTRPGSPSLMRHQSWPGILFLLVSQPSIHLPCSVKPSLQTAGSGLSRFSAAANQSSVAKRTEEPRVTQLRVFSSVQSGSRVNLSSDQIQIGLRCQRRCHNFFKS